MLLTSIYALLGNTVRARMNHTRLININGMLSRIRLLSAFKADTPTVTDNCSCASVVSVLWVYPIRVKTATELGLGI